MGSKKNLLFVRRKRKQNNHLKQKECVAQPSNRTRSRGPPSRASAVVHPAKKARRLPEDLDSL
eukprot:2665789-Prymnesium_polylepis.1